MNNKAELVSHYLRRLYERGLTTCYGGNISIRDDSKFFISETSIDKSLIKETNVSEVSFDGTILNNITPSSEYKIHEMIYKKRDDIGAIVHAHPPYATSYALAGKCLDTKISSEMYKNLGVIEIAEYAQPGSNELALIVSKAAQKSNSIIMSNHGVIVLSQTIEQAYYMMELMENLAQMTFITSLIGSGNHISEKQLKLLGGIQNV